MVVAFGATDGHTEESLRGVLDGVLHPLFAAEQFEVADEKASSAQGIGVLGSEFIGGKHFEHHLIVAFVMVERFDDPIAPAPDVRLAIANLAAVGPTSPIT